MAKLRKFRVSAAKGQDVVFRNMTMGASKGTLMQTAGRYNGRQIEINGRMLYNLGTCSYLGYDQRPELREGAIAATQDYGTQFSISRGYLECPLYQDLEANLEAMTRRPTLVTPTTTLGHMAALPVLIHDNDAVIIDQFAHASLHMATELLREIPVHLVRHSRMDLLEQLIQKLSPEHENIWLILDGLYSMFGDFAPFAELDVLLQRYPQLHLYIDDAHATSWLGTDGRGDALMHLGHHARVVVALSLNKAFSASGGALAFPTYEMKTRIRRCGGPMLFSGPIQPPMLGAAVASSALHLTEAHGDAQAALMERIDFALATIERLGLPLATQHRTPIFFIPFDSYDDATNEVLRLQKEGFYVCPSTFPAVPVNSPGVRFTITLHSEMEEIEAFLESAAAGVRKLQQTYLEEALV